MSVLSSYIIIFLLTTILFTSPFTQCQEISKLDFLIGQILEPYTNHLTTFKENIHTTLQTPLMSFLINAIPQEIFEDNLDYCVPSSPQRTPNKSKPALDTLPSMSHNNRMLQPSITCLSGGYGVEASVNMYICNGKPVSKSFYEQIRGVGCYKTTYQREMCYCPFDFYGLECENFNSPVCEIQRVSHPLTQCSAQNSRYYVYDYGQNDMPCYHVDKNKPLELEFKLVCKNEDPRWNYEGVKVEEDLDYTVTSTTYPFTHYAINTPELKISQSATMALQIKFANWERIFKPFVLADQITPNKAVGYENIKYTVDLKSIADHYSKSGRYTYEVILDSDLMNLGQVLGVLEDAEYAEPVKTKPIVSFRFMLYLFVICLVVLVGYVLYKFRNVSLPKRRRKESYEPLIEMHDVSEQSPAST